MTREEIQPLRGRVELAEAQVAAIDWHLDKLRQIKGAPGSSMVKIDIVEQGNRTCMASVPLNEILPVLEQYLEGEVAKHQSLLELA